MRWIARLWVCWRHRPVLTPMTPDQFLGRR